MDHKFTLFIKPSYAPPVPAWGGYSGYRPRAQPTSRIRRGTVVDIPERWRGVVTYRQTIRKRRSKQGHGYRTRVPSHTLKDGTYPTMQYLRRRENAVKQELIEHNYN